MKRFENGNSILRLMIIRVLDLEQWISRTNKSFGSRTVNIENGWKWSYYHLRMPIFINLINK